MPAAPRRLIALALALTACSGGGGGGGGPLPAPPPAAPSPPAPTPAPTTRTRSLAVDASRSVGDLAPLWRDHYDLSYTHLAYSADPGFLAEASALKARSWRCSVGRWEVGTPPPAGGDSLDPAALRACEREFYRGPNKLAAADDPANYDFAYLDDQIAALLALGVQPFLCFDYTPFTLSSEQDPLNANNLGRADPSLSFSNGIRTAPPADPAVYARVVRNTIRHLRGLFKGSSDTGVAQIEIGNEPDLYNGSGPARFFWTGDRAQWVAVYQAVAAEVEADPAIRELIELGGGSFAFQPFEPSPSFAQDAIAALALSGARLDFVSTHAYSDDPAEQLRALIRLRAILDALAISPDIAVAEWGRALDGLDPVYDRIEHGLFRAKAIIFMQTFGVRFAHEALIRDPFRTPGGLGLLTTAPAQAKPAADVYKALNLLNPTPRALPITIDPGAFALAGRDDAGGEVVVAAIIDDPGPGARTRLELAVDGLPWGAAPFAAERFVVSDATNAAGLGPVLAAASSGAGGAFQDAVEAGPGEGQLVIWRLRVP